MDETGGCHDGTSAGDSGGELAGDLCAEIFRTAVSEEAADMAVAGSLRTWIEQRIGRKLNLG